MTTQQQIKNILAFLSIFFGESKLWHEDIMKFPPDYIIEKFIRYIQSTRHESDWGLHPLLRRNVFEPYCKKHKIPFEQYGEIECPN
jgi:hypothetical protein